MRAPGWIRGPIERLAAPVDIASLAAFRILFGLLMAIGCVRFMAKGWVRTQLLEPTFHFTYPGLELLRPWPGAAMYVHFAVMLAAALGIVLGLFYRASAALFLLTFAYAELVDRASYLNHYYLATLLAALLLMLPAGRAFSLDAWRQPARALDALPGFALVALRLQVGVVYVFAGVAKLNRDWLFAAQPLREWLAARGDLPVLGALLRQPAAAYLASWSGALFDLAVVPLLLWPRTRRLGFALVLTFHAVTALLFPIGMFPWIMIACTTLFYAPSWPRRWLPNARGATTPRVAPASRALLALLLLHCSVQLALPLYRHLAFADSAWTYQGFDFAWKVMLVEKVGSVELVVTDRETGQRFQVAPRRYLVPWQERAMVQDPELIRALALHVAREQRRAGHRVAVTAHAFASLNGRPAQRLLRPDVDLAQPLPAGWILPLR